MTNNRLLCVYDYQHMSIVKTAVSDCASVQRQSFESFTPSLYLCALSKTQPGLFVGRTLIWWFSLLYIEHCGMLMVVDIKR